MKKKTIIILVLGLVAILCSPIVVFTLCKDNIRIGFWGAYLGSIISAVVAFGVLYIQRMDNHNENKHNRVANKYENRKNRNLQLKEIRYQQEMAWLTDFRRAVVDNIAVYSPDSIVSAIDLMLKDEEYTHSDDMNVQEKIKVILNQIVQVDTIVGILVVNRTTENLTNYYKTRREMYHSFCGITRDIQNISTVFFCMNNRSHYTKLLIERCSSIELKKSLIRNYSENGYDSYILSKDLENILKKMRDELYTLFESFRQESINCIAKEYQRIKNELESEHNVPSIG